LEKFKKKKKRNY
jgi:hypothetical protein